MRRSKLDVIRRLAKLEADRTLRGLGEANAEVRRVATSLDAVRESSAASQRERALASGQRADADAISAAHRRERWLRERDESLTSEFAEAREEHERARESVAKARLRVRAIENAIATRARRSDMEARRAESRRMDELSRGATRSGEDG